MHVVVIGPRLLPTDGMIMRGSNYLFNKVGIRLDEYVTIKDSGPEDIVIYKEPTHIIILGTPWLWDQCWKSHKYQNTINFLNKYPYAKLLLFGVGSCLPLGKEKLIADDLRRNQEQLTPLFYRANAVIFRDIYAEYIAKGICRAACTLPCPAYYALATEPGAMLKQDVVVWYDPSLGIAKIDWKRGSPEMEQYIQGFKDQIAAVSPSKIYCVGADEQKTAIEYGLMTPTLIGGVDEAAILLNNAKSIYSGRVHLSVPAYGVLGRSIHLVPVDSRANVLTNVVEHKIIHPNEALYIYLPILEKFKQP